MDTMNTDVTETPISAELLADLDARWAACNSIHRRMDEKMCGNCSRDIVESRGFFNYPQPANGDEPMNNHDAEIEATFVLADSDHRDIMELMARNPMPYNRVLERIGRLAEMLSERETDEFIWCRVGEFQEFDLGALLAGAWHHLDDLDSYVHPYHSDVYQALGAVYSPGMSGEMQDEDDGAALVLVWLNEGYSEVAQ